MLRLENVTVSYDNKVAINNLSAHFKPGVVYGLIGSNGAGKSTLMQTLIGLLPAYAGKIEFGDGRDLKKNRFWVKEHAVYVAEQAHLLPYLTGREYIKMVAKIYGQPIEMIDKYIDLMGLNEKADTLIDSYSHGMRQKTGLAAAFIAQPKYIFLDEALNGVDSASLERIYSYLYEKKQTGCTIILASHNVEMIYNHTEQTYILHLGKIEAALEQKNFKEFNHFFETYLGYTR